MSTKVGIWFECQTCRGSFRNLEDFLAHKKLDHLEEFQSINYIIFEERRIQQCNDEQIVSVSPTAQGHEKESRSQLIIDPSQVNFEDEYYDEESDSSSNPPEFPWQSFYENAKLIKKESDQSIGHDFVDNNEEEQLSHLKIISSETLNAATLSDFKFETSLELESICPNDSANRSDVSPIRRSFLQTQHKPLARPKRLTCKKILPVSKIATKYKSHNIPCPSPADPQEGILKATAEAKIVKIKTGLIRCQLCLCAFNSESDRAVHLSSCYLLHPHRHRFCILCNIKFCSKSSLNRHISRRHISKPKRNSPVSKNSSKTLTCKKIQNSLASKIADNFKSHIIPCCITAPDSQVQTLTATTTKKVKIETNLIKCQLCLGQFISELELAAHLNSCYLLHPHCHDRFCVLCNTKFANKANLKRHILIRHITNKPKSSRFGIQTLQCSKNVKKEVKANSSQPFNLVYIDFQQFKCPHIYCEKSFTTEYILQKHLIKHADLVTKTFGK